MDGHRFDRLTRTLAVPTGRRRFLKTLAGALLGGTAAIRIADGTAAACPSGQVAASGGRCLCKTTGRAPVNGACPCGAGQTDCGGGVCEDLSSDLANCGTCGGACPDPERQICRAGQCWCLPGLTQCGNRCVDLLTDSDNCGACTNRCPDPTPGTCEKERICVSGSCTFTPQDTGFECRPAAGDCDVAELCDGTSLECPEDRFLGSAVVCRPVMGDCDLEERCLGNSPHCPQDRFKGSETVCRQSGGPCDPEERCTGNAPTCPANAGNVGERCGDVCCTAPQVCIVTLVDSAPERTCGIGGGSGQPCRVDGDTVFCDADLICNPTLALCQPCGGTGQLCCPGDVASACDPGNTCVLDPNQPLGVGICQTCGGDGEFCCGGLGGGLDGTCDDGFTCLPDFLGGFRGVCVVCGGRNQDCCGLREGICDPGLVCIIPDGDDPFETTCIDCGGPNQACCRSFTCNPGYTCDGLIPGTCTPCGNHGQRCCINFTTFEATCNADLSCIQGGQDVICVNPNECGAAGQPCCDLVSTSNGPSGSCDSPNLTCISEGGNLVCR